MTIEAALSDVSKFAASSSYELVRKVEAGLPIASLDLLKEWGLTFSEIGNLVIPPRTLKHRKARGERLTTEESERFLRVIRLLELSDRVFGNREKALGWLREIDDQIEDRALLSLAASENGAKLVEGRLWGIAEGVYS